MIPKTSFDYSSQRTPPPLPTSKRPRQEYHNEGKEPEEGTVKKLAEIYEHQGLLAWKRDSLPYEEVVTRFDKPENVWKPAPLLGAEVADFVLDNFHKLRRTTLSRCGAKAAVREQSPDPIELVESGSQSCAHLDALLNELNQQVNLDATLAFKDISFTYHVKNRDEFCGKSIETTVLQGISGVFDNTSKMIMIMGPSGSGKSTLLDILAAQKTTPYDGIVYVNGTPRTKDFKKITSYIPQSDAFISGQETVKEAVDFVYQMTSNTAKLTNPVESILKALGMGHKLNSLVGDECSKVISGGEKRRVSLAKALIKFPSLIFSDEITSGLSSSDTVLVLKVVSKFCHSLNMKFFTSIHQPSTIAFEMFDHLILLSDRGKCVYNGPASAAGAYFKSTLKHVPPKNMSVPEYILDTVSSCTAHSAPRNLETEYEKTVQARNEALSNYLSSSADKLNDTALAEKLQTPPLRVEIGLVTCRTLRHVGRDRRTLLTLTGQKVCLGLLIGLVYLDIRKKPGELTYQLAFLFCLMIAVAGSAMQSVGPLVQERAVFHLESRGALLYSPLSYLIATGVRSTLTSIVGNFIFILICYFMAGFESSGFLYVWLVTTVLYWTIDSVVSLIVALSTNCSTATSFISLVVSVLGIFNGFTANTVSTPASVSWVSYISPYYWSFAGLLSSAFVDFDFSNTIYQTFDVFIESFGYPSNTQGTAIAINFGFIIVYRMLQYLALTYYTPVEK